MKYCFITSQPQARRQHPRWHWLLLGTALLVWSPPTGSWGLARSAQTTAKAAHEQAARALSEPEPATGFSLELEEMAPLDQRRDGFSLELELYDLTAAAPTSSARPSLTELSLSSRSPRKVGTQTLLGSDFAEELRQARWPEGIGRREHMLSAELARGLSGGTVGACRAAGPNVDCSTGPLIDVIYLGKLITKWWRGLKELRKPPGALINWSQQTTLQVTEADGSQPTSINVLPLTGGWVGEVLLATCEQGRCLVEGLPDQTCTVLVRGQGAALVPLPRFDVMTFVRLGPVGWLRLRPESPLDHSQPIRVRVVDVASGLTVPVVRWLNPARREFFTLPAEGIPLLLPLGDYRVEQFAGKELVHEQVTVVDGQRTTHVVSTLAGNASTSTGNASAPTGNAIGTVNE